jgi:hypothetical protein
LQWLGCDIFVELCATKKPSSKLEGFLNKYACPTELLGAATYSSYKIQGNKKPFK